jgi:hypothetical protein
MIGLQMLTASTCAFIFATVMATPVPVWQCLRICRLAPPRTEPDRAITFTPHCRFQLPTADISAIDGPVLEILLML